MPTLCRFWDKIKKGAATKAAAPFKSAYFCFDAVYAPFYRALATIQFCRNISIAPASPPKLQNIRFFIGQQTATSSSPLASSGSEKELDLTATLDAKAVL